jgi:N4-gp56 family major capsid protein
MAFAGTPSLTTTAGLSSTVNHYFEKVMLEWMRPQFRYYAFASKKPLPPRTGDAVVFNRKVALNLGYTLSQGVPISSVKTISANQVSALVQQIGDSVTLSDISRLESTNDTNAYALELMADQAANTVEQYIQQCILADTGLTHFVKHDTGAKEGHWGLVICSGGAARLALSDIRKAVTRLQANNCPEYDGRGYIAIAHPNQLQDLYSDTTFASWAANQNPERMYEYEVGQVFNTHIIKSTYVPIAPGSTLSGDSISTATGSCWRSLGMAVFGKDAFAVTELDGGIKQYHLSGATKTDPNDLTEVYAWKANIAAKVLNPSAIVYIWNSDGTQVNNSLGTACTAPSAPRTMGFTNLFPGCGTSAQLTLATAIQYNSDNNYLTSW